MARKLAIVLLFVLTAVVMVWIRVAVGASSEHRAGVEAYDRKDLGRAVHHFDRAIHWYAPGSKSVQASVAALQRIAADYEAAQDTQGALYATRILRSALHAVRHVRQPYPDVIESCNRKIALLMAQRAHSDQGDSIEVAQQKRYAQLSRPVGPKTAYALLAQAGFLGWMACGFLFIWRAVRPKKGLKVRPAMLFGALFVLFYVLWMFGLAKA